MGQHAVSCITKNRLWTTQPVFARINRTESLCVPIIGLFVLYDKATTQKGDSTMAYSVKYVRGHMEVYGEDGSFLFSADSDREIRETLEELYD